MAKYIDAEPLYKQMVEQEELARQRVIDTPSRLPHGDANPYATRYATQLDERTKFKFMLADTPAADVVEVVRCKDCKHRRVAEYGPMKYECELDTGDPYCHGRQAWWPDWFCAEGVRKDG